MNFARHADPGGGKKQDSNKKAMAGPISVTPEGLDRKPEQVKGLRGTRSRRSFAPKREISTDDFSPSGSTPPDFSRLDDRIKKALVEAAFSRILTRRERTEVKTAEVMWGSIPAPLKGRRPSRSRHRHKQAHAALCTSLGATYCSAQQFRVTQREGIA